MITGTAFVDLLPAYDTMNHKLLIQKLKTTHYEELSEAVVKQKILCGAEQ